MTVNCGWILPDRTSSGILTWNPALFPSGYPALGKLIHGLGLRFGIYSDAGVQMCMTGTPAQVGSLCEFTFISLRSIELGIKSVLQKAGVDQS